LDLKPLPKLEEEREKQYQYENNLDLDFDLSQFLENSVAFACDSSLFFVYVGINHAIHPYSNPLAGADFPPTISGINDFSIFDGDGVDVHVDVHNIATIDPAFNAQFDSDLVVAKATLKDLSIVARNYDTQGCDVDLNVPIIDPDSKVVVYDFEAHLDIN